MHLVGVILWIIQGVQVMLVSNLKDGIVGKCNIFMQSQSGKKHKCVVLLGKIQMGNKILWFNWNTGGFLQALFQVRLLEGWEVSQLSKNAFNRFLRKIFLKVFSLLSFFFISYLCIYLLGIANKGAMWSVGCSPTHFSQWGPGLPTSDERYSCANRGCKFPSIPMC